MKREAKLLLEKACNSLVLCIEIFNRPQDRGRISGTLIQLDHGFEMLMKAAIVQRGGRIREKNRSNTIGFDACVRRSLNDGAVRYLTEDQAFVLRTINSLRDAEQHYFQNISEGQLYVHIQSGVTLFRDILKNVFDQELSHRLPKRVLPISIEVPVDMVTLFDSEISEIKKLLEPGRRRHLEAVAKLRPLAIFDAAIRGDNDQPQDGELKQLGADIASGVTWRKIFEGVAMIELTTEGSGMNFSLRLSKKEGIPIRLVNENEPEATAVAVKRVDELGFYSLGARDLAKKCGLSVPKALAVVEHLGLGKDPNCYKEIKVGKSLFKRYSPRALDAIKKALAERSVDEIWAQRRRK